MLQKFTYGEAFKIRIVFRWNLESLVYNVVDYFMSNRIDLLFAILLYTPVFYVTGTKS